VHDVFVSYSQIDKTVADAVVAGLEAEGLRCWVAPRDITPGTSWGEAIVDAISGSSAMALVLSSNSNASPQVIREVERAVAHGVVIVPFRIEEIDPTGAMAYFLGTEHWLDALTPPLERHIDRLGRAIGSVLSGDAAPSGADQPPPAVRRRRTGPIWAWVAGGLAAGVLAAVGIASLFSSGDEVSGADVTGGNDVVVEDPSSGTGSITDTPVVEPDPVPAVALEEVGAYPTSRTAHDLSIDGNFLLLANGADGIVHLSVADPTQPRPMAEYSGTDVQTVLLDGSVGYVLSGEYSMEFVVVDLDGSGGYMLSGEEGQVLRSDSLYNLELAGDFLYIGGHDYVGIVYVADPLAPVLVFEWEPSGNTGNPATVHVAGDVGLFGAGWDGLYLFDVTDPSRPIELGVWDSPNWVIDVETNGDVAFVTLGETGLATIDISDPRSPLLISRIDLPGFASPLALSDDVAFVGLEPNPNDAGTRGSIAIVDVSDPAALEVVDVVEGFEAVGGLEVAGGHLFMTDLQRGLFVFEIVTVPGA
jgi:hypothetical protein